MRRQLGFAIGLAMLAPPLASSAEPITAANWRRHPAIVEIEAIYRETSEAAVAGRLRKQVRHFRYCRPWEDTVRALHLDEAGGARSYEVYGGWEDAEDWNGAQSAHAERFYYYDGDGALRFVFVKATASDGTRLEYRIYLSKNGRRLWEARKNLKGPGWKFPDRLPDHLLVRNPRESLQSENLCDELYRSE